MSETLPSGRRGQLLAVGLTIAGLAVLWVAIVGPLMSWYEARSQGLEDRRMVAARMARIAQTIPDLMRQAEALRAAAPAGRDIALEAPSDAVAGARLQQRMQDLATAAGIRFSSIETLPAQQQGGYRRISLRVTCSAALPVLVGLLQKLEVSNPRMLIDDLDLDASPDLNRPDGIAIGANFTVIAFRPGSAP
ncbi:type II secretion system protein GspM [Acidisoma sp.]|uniref:type II secretion system protein GspM n=1 Tax=Acidisoma sp. TaxID=1872115 RepID=UPI003B0019DE